MALTFAVAAVGVSLLLNALAALGAPFRRDFIIVVSTLGVGLLVCYGYGVPLRTIFSISPARHAARRQADREETIRALLAVAGLVIVFGVGNDPDLGDLFSIVTILAGVIVVFATPTAPRGLARRDWWLVAAPVALPLALFALFSATGALGPVRWQQGMIEDFLFWVAANAFAQLLLEEFGFRGLMVGLSGDGRAVAWSAAAAGVWHATFVLFTQPVSVIATVLIDHAALAVILGVLYVDTGSLILPALAHGLADATVNLLSTAGPTGAGLLLPAPGPVGLAVFWSAQSLLLLLIGVALLRRYARSARGGTWGLGGV